MIVLVHFDTCRCRNLYMSVLLPFWHKNRLHIGHNRSSASRCRLCTTPQDIDDKIQHLEEKMFLRHIQNSRRGNRVCLLIFVYLIKKIQLDTWYMYLLGCRFGIVPSDKSHTHHLPPDKFPLRNHLSHRIGGRHFLGTHWGKTGSTSRRCLSGNILLGIVCMLRRPGVYRLDTQYWF